MHSRMGNTARFRRWPVAAVLFSVALAASPGLAQLHITSYPDPSFIVPGQSSLRFSATGPTSGKYFVRRQVWGPFGSKQTLWTSEQRAAPHLQFTATYPVPAGLTNGDDLCFQLVSKVEVSGLNKTLGINKKIDSVHAQSCIVVQIPYTTAGPSAHKQSVPTVASAPGRVVARRPGGGASRLPTPDGASGRSRGASGLADLIVELDQPGRRLVVRNIGKAGAGASQLSFRARGLPDRVLTIGAIGAGAVRPVAITSDLNRYLKGQVIADSGQQVPESNESNNVWQAPKP